MANEAKMPPNLLRLFYRKPAQAWTDALPLGNGRLGAMVFGGIEAERFQLNEDTFWSGTGHQDGSNPQAKAVLPEVRRLIFAGKYVEANALCKEMQGPFTQAYQPLGDLRLNFDLSGTPVDYERWLDLTTATAGVRYQLDGAVFNREAWISYPDQALVIRLSCEQPGRLSFVAQLDTPQPYMIHAMD
jgi:alpha-L-fucosidase 2